MYQSLVLSMVLGLHEGSWIESPVDKGGPLCYSGPHKLTSLESKEKEREVWVVI